MIIYKATNQTNGKMYIGQTVNSLNKRKLSHMNNVKRSNLPFHNAIRKHGPDNFNWQVICICPDIDSLNEQEEYYITFYDSMNVGYNLQSGGENRLHSDVTKQKMSENNAKPMLGKKHPPETIEKMRQVKIGKKFSKETKEKMRIAALNVSDETKDRRRQTRLGMKHSEEAKKNMRIAALNMSDETKKKISETRIRLGLAKGKNNPMYGVHNYGRKVSIETRKKLSKSITKYWKNIL